MNESPAHKRTLEFPLGSMQNADFYSGSVLPTLIPHEICMVFIEHVSGIMPGKADLPWDLHACGI